MYEERLRCYELLGLAPGATVEELKAAHRDLVKVWHPDRFAHDPRLQQKAQEKLKELNEAYEFLTSGRPARRAQPPVSEGPAEPTPAPRRGSRWPYVLLAAAVCGAVFAAAYRVVWTRGETPAAAADRSRASGVSGRPSRSDAPADPKDKKRHTQETAEAPAKSDAAPPAGDAAAARTPLPTVTVLIDPTTGLLATPACPVRSRTTYAAGIQPGRQCDAHVNAKAPTRAPE